MKYSFLIAFLLVSLLGIAQPNREALPLIDEANFVMAFRFQYENEIPFTVTFSRKEKTDFIAISDAKCRRNNMAYELPIVDYYTYEQFLNYLQDIEITQFQPKSNGIDAAAKLQVHGSISITRIWAINAFVFRHNPKNEGTESQILGFIVNILKDNATDDCIKQFVEQLSIYVNGE